MVPGVHACANACPRYTHARQYTQARPSPRVGQRACAGTCTMCASEQPGPAIWQRPPFLIQVLVFQPLVQGIMDLSQGTMRTLSVHPPHTRLSTRADTHQPVHTRTGMRAHTCNHLCTLASHGVVHLSALFDEVDARKAPVVAVKLQAGVRVCSLMVTILRARMHAYPRTGVRTLTS